MKKAREIISDVAHQQWMNWGKSLIKMEDLSPDRVTRWSELFVEYDTLSEDMKELDRREADKFIKALKVNGYEIRKLK